MGKAPAQNPAAIAQGIAEAVSSAPASGQPRRCAACAACRSPRSTGIPETARQTTRPANKMGSRPSTEPIESSSALANESSALRDAARRPIRIAWLARIMARSLSPREAACRWDILLR